MWYALQSFAEPIVLIAGGKGKQNDYTPILPLIRKHVKAVVLIGDEAPAMEAAFAGYAPTVRAGHSMELAVEQARSLAVPGDVILLSPACASFDMFNNYEHRGESFKTLVNQLIPASEAVN